MNDGCSFFFPPFRGSALFPYTIYCPTGFVLSLKKLRRYDVIAWSSTHHSDEGQNRTFSV